MNRKYNKSFAMGLPNFFAHKYDGEKRGLATFRPNAVGMEGGGGGFRLLGFRLFQNSTSAYAHFDSVQ